MADMDRTAIITLAREYVGITDEAKGGLTNALLNPKVNHVLNRMCLLAEAPRTVFYLSTTAGSKYLPYEDQLLWIKQVTYIPTSGNPYDLNLMDGAVFPTFQQRPKVYWHTAVNIPDVNGRSTPTLGLHPYPNEGDGTTKNVRVEAFQKVKDLSIATDIPEFVSAIHPYVAAGLAIEMMLLHPDRHRANGPELKLRFQEGVEQIRKLTHGAASKRPSRDTDVRGYGAAFARRV
jgi:hypothetical protein